MSIAIRPAVENEADTIKAMIHVEGLDPTTLNWRHFLVAELDGQIVGVGQIKEYGGIHELGSLVVQHDHRGKGIARQLIAALEAKAKRPLYLSCRDTMQPYYEKFGYQVISSRETPLALRLKLTIPNVLFRIPVVAMIKRGR